MATEKELKAAVAPVLARYLDWRYSRGWLFPVPIGYYLRGVALSGAWSSREHFTLKRSVYPLFESPYYFHRSWGRSFPIPGKPSHDWNVFHPHFADKLAELIEQEVLPVTAHIATGAGFLHYLTENYTESGWQDWGKALACIHMGELTKARELLRPIAETIRTPPFQQLLGPGGWGSNVLELLRLIEEDPASIPAHCEATARKSVAFNKLEKFWEPVPFVYDRDR